MESHWYCSEPCLETGILQRLEKTSRPREKSAFVSQRTRFGFLLLQNGVITKEQLDLAIAEQQKGISNHTKDGEERLGHYMQNMGFVTERDITLALSRQFSLPVINLVNQRFNPKALKMVPAAIIQRLKFLPVDYDAPSNSLSLVTYDPTLIPAMINLRGILNCDLSIFLGDETTVRQLIGQAVSSASDVHTRTSPFAEALSEDLSELAALIVSEAQNLNVKSLSVGYFNHLIWARFFTADEYHDSVYEYLPLSESQPEEPVYQI
jgi:hypothetical protein